MSTGSILSILAYPQYGYHLVCHTGLSLVHYSYLSVGSLHTEPSTSSTLSLVPSGLLTPTAPSNVVDDTQSESQLYSQPGPSAEYSGIPSAFLVKPQSLKGYCWLPSNGTEFFANGKWKWQCARCK